jgi:hypothetical protein
MIRDAAREHGKVPVRGSLQRASLPGDFRLLAAQVISRVTGKMSKNNNPFRELTENSRQDSLVKDLLLLSGFANAAPPGVFALVFSRTEKTCPELY